VTAVATAEVALPLLHRPWAAIVTDLRLPGQDGLAVLAEARRLGSTAVRVVVTSFADKDRAIAALNLGADHLLEKPFGVETLSAVLAGLLGPPDGRRSPVPEDRLAALPLDDRERRIVAALLRGAGNREIAAELGLAEQTVKNQLSAIYERLGVSGRPGLMAALFSV
jgi:DNA-binding NarL/FixJ family response regulator